MTAHDSRNRREAQAATGEFRGEERIENTRLRRLVHAAAVIAHFEADVVAGRKIVAPAGIIDTAKAGADDHRAGPIANRLGGVDYQVHDDLLDLAGIGLDGR